MAAPLPAWRHRLSAQLPFNHPVFVLFTSGTTGKPKCIVHGAGGTLLQNLKTHKLHFDVRARRPLLLFLHDQLGGLERAFSWFVHRGGAHALRRLAVRAKREDPF